MGGVSADAFKNTQFVVIDEILLSVYLLYKRSPKKLSELKEIRENLKEEMEFTEGGVKPQKSKRYKMGGSQCKRNKEC